MAARILIVDDETRYLRLLEFNLHSEGYQVIKAVNGQEAIDCVAKQYPDLVLLDIRMPVLDGFSACERIRKFSNVPIIIITAIGSEYDRIRGLDLGADDYLVKPFSVNELLARVRSVLRRVQKMDTAFPTEIFVYKNLRIDLTRAEVYLDNMLINLSPTEYRLLLLFARNIGKFLSSEYLLTEVWGEKYHNDKEILWVCLSRIRQKLEVDPKHPRFIVTRPGMGYTMPSQNFNN